MSKPTVSAVGGAMPAGRPTREPNPTGMSDQIDVIKALVDAAYMAARDLDGWFDALTGLGARLEAEADERARRGHDVSAAGAYLRAANYRYAGFWYVLGTRAPERWSDAWRAHRRCLDGALARRPGVERITVDCDGVRLPVVCFRATAPDPAAS